MERNPLNTIFFKLAIELERRFADILVDNQVHFRGNLNSISLISIGQEKPELGVKCSLHKEWTEGIIQNYINKIKAKPFPLRPTPEKLLQAWIIKNSRENKHFLTFDKTIRFITSELAIDHDLKGKVVSDIIGFDTENNRLVIMELKSERHLGRLIDQLKNFEEIVSQNQSFFEELLDLYGYQIKNEPLKSIVWPKPKKFSLSNLKEQNIAEYVFKKENNDYIIIKTE